MDRLYISNEADRLTVASILVKNKYTVRQNKFKQPGKRTFTHFLEYEVTVDPDDKEQTDGE